jgi:hypothetical protein
MVMNVMMVGITKDPTVNASSPNNASANFTETACFTCAASIVGN